MEPCGPASGLLLLHVNALWGSAHLQPKLKLLHGPPAEVKCLDQEVRPSFNKYIWNPSYPGHMLACRSAVMAGQVSRQMRRWWEAGSLSCLVSKQQHQPSPPLLCLSCSPNQASQSWHIAYCTTTLHGPQSTSIAAPVSLCRRAGKKPHLTTKPDTF